MTVSRFLSRAILVLCAAAALPACGRRGALEPPPDAVAQPAAQGQLLSGPTTAPAQKKKGNEPFVLDPLLD